MADEVVKNKGLASIGIKVTIGGKEIKYVTEIPELGAAPSALDTTTLKDMEYGILYNNKDADSDFRILKGYETAGEAQPVEITFPDGTAFSYDAYISVRTNAAKVNELLGATVTTNPQTEIKTSNPTASQA